MKNFPYSLSLILFWLTTSLIAQERHQLQIYVVDALSNDPLPFVNIFILPDGKGGTTNENGKITFELVEGRRQVQLSFLGYTEQNRDILLNRDLNLDIFLESEDAKLQTVLVTAENDRSLLTRPEMGVQTISSGELKSLPSVLGEVDVLKGLQLQSGVSSAGEVSNGLSVRGGSLDQNLLLFDGAPIFTPTHLFGLFSVFTPDAVGSIKLYRANIPAQFGGRIASVVDVRSRNPSSDGFKMSGGIGLVSSNLLIETPLSKDKKLKMIAAGRGGFNDFLFGLIERLKGTKSRFADATLKVRYAASERSYLTLSSFYSYDFYQLALINALPNINSSSNQFQYRTLNASLEWLKIASDGKGDWRTRLVSGNYKPQLLFPEESSESVPNYEANIQQRSLTSQLSREIKAHRLKAGLEIVHYNIRPGRLNPNGSTQVNPVVLEQENGVETSLFAEMAWQFGDKLSVLSGLRYTHFFQFGAGEQRSYRPDSEREFVDLMERRQFGSGEVMQTYGAFEPRLGLSYLLSERHSLKLAYAESRQYLQNIFNATTPLPTSRWKIADNNILPQRGRMVSAGWAGVLKPGRYRATLEAYYRRTDNVLEYQAGADFFLKKEVETDLLQGKAESWGIEVGVEKTSGRLTGLVNYTFARSFLTVAGPTFSTSINEGNRYPGYFDQPHVLNANLILDKGRTHELGFNFVLRSNRPYTVPTGFLEINELPIPLFLERNNDRLPAYHRMDFSWTIHNFSREKRRWTGDWTFTVYNLYGRNNAENIYFGPRSSSNRPPPAIFSGSPLGSYQLSIFAAPVFSLSYRFVFE